MDVMPEGLHKMTEKTVNIITLRKWPVLMLFSRTLLFFVFGLVFLIILQLAGSPEPFKAVVKWWPFQVILTNAVCFLLLKWLCGKENKSFLSLINYNRKMIRKDIAIFFLLLPVCGAVGYFGVYGAMLLFYNNVPPVNFAQPLPVWALILVIALFPTSNALIETTTYFGFSYERLKGKENGAWRAVLLSVFFLALQHTAIPLYFDIKYMLCRLVSFLPMSLVVGLSYSKIRRLSPLIPGHFFVDWSLVLMIIMSY